MVAVGAGAAVAAEQKLAATSVGVDEEIPGGLDGVLTSDQGGVVLEKGGYGQRHGIAPCRISNLGLSVGL